MSKLIFLAFSFNEAELYQLFDTFYKELDENGNETFDKDEIKECFEKFANEKLGLLGKQGVKRVIGHIGV